MSEPLQVTREQLQAILDAINHACVSTYHGYQFTDSDVQSVNQQLQTSGIEVDLNIVRVDFADALNGAGGLQQAFQGIETAIEQGFTNVIKHAFDTSYSPGSYPSSAKLDEITTGLRDIQQSIQQAQTPIIQADLSQVEVRLASLTASIDSLTEAAILGTRGEPIPKNKAERAAKKVYDALQAKPEVYEALLALLDQERATEDQAMRDRAATAIGAKLSPVHDATDSDALLQAMYQDTIDETRRKAVASLAKPKPLSAEVEMAALWKDKE